MKKRTFRCHICGNVENPTNWVESCAKDLVRTKLCFKCHHWHVQHVNDVRSPKYSTAIVDGGHYMLCPHTDSYLKGFGGRKFKFEFIDGHIEECDNVWFQGDITEAHPHWRKIMPDNARIIQ
jgi:hypothetical protein